MVYGLPWFTNRLCIFVKPAEINWLLNKNGDIYEVVIIMFVLNIKLGNLIETPLTQLPDNNTKQKQFCKREIFSFPNSVKSVSFALHVTEDVQKHRTIQGFGKAHNQLCEAPALSYGSIFKVICKTHLAK